MSASASVAAGIGSPTFVFAALFSATLRVSEDAENEGALLAAARVTVTV